jgi:hypothetical protein
MTRLFLVLALVGALAACGTVTIYTDPGAYSVRDDTAVIRADRIALLNAYSEPTMFEVANRMQVDLRQVTDTAIAMMARQLRKDGVEIDASAEKKVTVKVTSAHMAYVAIPFAERWRTSLNMDAALGDGTSTSVRAENSAPIAFRSNAHNRSVEGAVLFAVTNLLNDRRFVAYANAGTAARR